MKVRKAVIPAAGLGTRVLPATKAQPKEMLVIVDKPSLQYVVEELADSGIEDIVIITGRNKNSLEDHFDCSYEIETTLQQENKKDLLDKIRHLSNLANIFYVRQNRPLGLGHAIWKAKPFIGREPFVVALGDDIMYNPLYPVTKQLIDVYDQYGTSVIGCQEVDEKNVHQYGIVKPAEYLDQRTCKISDFVEKPPLVIAPSRLACFGRYVLSENIFQYLEKGRLGVGGEIQLTDGIVDMLHGGEDVLSYCFHGKRYDIGSKIGLLKANIEFGLRNSETSRELQEYFNDELKTFLNNLNESSKNLL
jgi:UTP--glucose-1-phosphate uridylyltransferase